RFVLFDLDFTEAIQATHVVHAVHYEIIPHVAHAITYIRQRRPRVRFGSKADIGARPANVRFTPKSGHSAGALDHLVGASKQWLGIVQVSALFAFENVTSANSKFLIRASAYGAICLCLYSDVRRHRPTAWPVRPGKFGWTK